MQYRTAIGMYNNGLVSPSTSKAHASISVNILHNVCSNIAFYLLVIILLCLLANDIHVNPGPLHSDGCIKICHINVQSMKRNLEKPKQIQLQYGDLYDIITVSETWLSHDIPSTRYKLDGFYPIYRNDRRGDMFGGGVAAWVSQKLVAKRRLDLENPNIEALWLQIRSKNNKFLLCTVYRPPNVGIQFWDDLQTMIDNVKSTHVHSSIIIAGDLNADFASRDGDKLKQFIDTNNFVSHINEPTRITPTSQRCLDRILSNIPYHVRSSHVIAPLLHNDHCTISITLKFRLNKAECYTRVMWDYSMADYNGLRLYLSSINWDQECDNYTNVEYAAEQWTHIIYEAAKQFIPNKLVTVRPRDKPWYNSDLRRLKRHVNRSHNRAKRTNTTLSWATFRKVRNSYIQNCRDAESRFASKQIDKLTESPFSSKECWRLYRSVLDINTERGCPSFSHNGKVYTSNKDKANLMNTLFVEKSNIDDTGKVLPIIYNHPANMLSDLELSLTDVSDQLGALDISKAHGPDGVGPRLLKTIKSEIAPSMLKLFKASLAQQCVPQLWKRANVTPIYKKGDKSDPSNKRPISLLNTTGKILEKIIYKYIFNFIRDNSILSSWQSGFLPGCSTVTQLIELYHCFCQNIGNGKDISRAFDRVWHIGLLYKLEKAGLSGNLLIWIEHYLQEREQRVCIDGTFSEWGNIRSGIPQGSILGPLFFLIFINDITEVIRHTNIRLFADDICIYITIDNRDETRRLVCSDLQAIHEWSNQWLVEFSVPKTKSLVISTKPDKDLNLPLIMNNRVIEDVYTHKHLGVFLTHNLSWTTHIDSISQKAQGRLNVLLAFKFKLPRKSLERYYNSFVLPIMEYADVLWGSAPQQDLVKLDRIHL